MKTHPKPEFDESYFSTDTYENISFERFSQYWWSNRFYTILARRYGTWDTALLEIGCGLGHLVGQFEVDFLTYGIDINPWAVQQAKREFPVVPFSLASAEELPFADNVFGVVIIKHVVEHLPKPKRAIRELGRVLSPGGVLILSTPNLDSLLKPLKGEEWIGYQDPTHISLKSPAEWLNLLRDEAHLTVERVFSDGFWDTPYLPWIPEKLQKLLFGSLGGIQAITGLPFLPRRWGESIIVIARK
ncbi:MAG: 23S rRNA (guanine(745)-N(1))-methyltransferase [Chloroflexi bacterium]|nr:23S rRNA (guanine(745)-N(1))-methyltransferase [Chloroflexota bacterium]